MVKEKKMTWNYRTNYVYFQTFYRKKITSAGLGYETLRTNMGKLDWPINIYFYLQLPYMVFVRLKIFKDICGLNIV